MSLRAPVAPVPPAFTVAEVLRVGLPEHGREHGLKQFLDEKSIKPGLQAYKR